MKDISYYSEISIPNKTKGEFFAELEFELNNFVGTRKELHQAEKEANIKAHELAKENTKKRSEEMGRKYNEFKMDLATDNGIPHDHPKLDLLWQKAWEMGHSYGLSEVKIHFDDLAELIL